jgi:hypothetical protein
VWLLERDALDEVLSAEGDAAVEDVLAVALEHVAARHGRDERQRVARLGHQAAPQVVAGDAGLAGLVHREGVAHVDHRGSPFKTR